MVITFGVIPQGHHRFAMSSAPPSSQRCCVIRSAVIGFAV
jgi:hypothetical protein